MEVVLEGRFSVPPSPALLTAPEANMLVPMSSAGWDDDIISLDEIGSPAKSIGLIWCAPKIFVRASLMLSHAPDNSMSPFMIELIGSDGAKIAEQAVSRSTPSVTLLQAAIVHAGFYTVQLCFPDTEVTTMAYRLSIASSKSRDFAPAPQRYPQGSQADFSWRRRDTRYFNLNLSDEAHARRVM